MIVVDKSEGIHEGPSNLRKDATKKVFIGSKGGRASQGEDDHDRVETKGKMVKMIRKGHSAILKQKQSFSTRNKKKLGAFFFVFFVEEIAH